ncbi:MAG: hypothetical protein JO017_09130 [Actinobacteria bacterium]|nr:hypothetical protein [Actinomycetota bacterium]
MAGLPAWAIGVIELGAWLAAAVCERVISQVDARQRAPAALPEPVVQRAAAPPAPPVVASTPRPAPQPNPAPDPLAESVRPPAPAPPPPAPPEPPPPPAPRPTAPRPTGGRWNMQMLEQLARRHAPGDEELQYLLVYLRDYTDADGLLPASFDSLVRESFGSLLDRA